MTIPLCHPGGSLWPIGSVLFPLKWVRFYHFTYVSFQNDGNTAGILSLRSRMTPVWGFQNDITALLSSWRELVTDGSMLGVFNEGILSLRSRMTLLFLSSWREPATDRICVWPHLKDGILSTWVALRFPEWLLLELDPIILRSPDSRMTVVICPIMTIRASSSWRESIDW